MTVSDHTPDTQALEASLENLRASGITTVRLLYSDLHGVARGKDIPLSQFPRIAEHGIGFCTAVMSNDLRHHAITENDEPFPDLNAVADLATMRMIPWQEGVACCLADLRELDGAEYGSCPRHALRTAIAALAELGLTPIAGPELEFFMLERDPAGTNGFRRYVDQLSSVYTVGYGADPKGVVLEMLHACEQLGLGAFAANHEYENSQYEINLNHSSALDAADRAFLLKMAVKELAAKAGLLATFIGKPFNDLAGSGFHVHLSLVDDDAENAFADPSDAAGLSGTARAFAAGVIAHAPALAAFLTPTVNAYKRIVPGGIAPFSGNWGLDDRTAFVRVPEERGRATRLEVRAGDGSANPYLLIAGILFAGLDGIRRELEPPAIGSGETAAAAGEPLPRSLDRALDALEADEVLTACFEPALIRTFLSVKRAEADRFSRWVTDWELAEYANHL